MAATGPKNGATSPTVNSTQISPGAQIAIDEAEAIDSSIAEFAKCMEHEYGIRIEPEADGEIQRFYDPEGKPSNTDGWYYLHESGTQGVFGSWRRGDKHQWSSDSFQALPQEERDTIAEGIRNAQEHDAAERMRLQDEAATKAKGKLDQAKQASPKHRYLKDKRIKPSRLRQVGNKLLVPMQNTAGQTRNLQTISPSGKKRFLPRAEVRGNFALIGELPDTGTIHICEGFSTGMTVHEAFGTPVAAAMNAGNLLPVAQALRERLPDAVDIVIAADDDHGNPDNPGLNKAILAAKDIGATVIAPNLEGSGCPGTDFNDLANWNGKDSQSPLFRAIDLDQVPMPSEPMPLISQLPPVKPLTKAMLPESIGSFVSDTAGRLQVSPDYLAVASLIAVAGTVGSKQCIHPKQKDNWKVTPTLWGGLVGPPSAMKSASLSAVLQPVYAIEKELADAYDVAIEFHVLSSELADENLKAVKKEAAKKFKNDKSAGVKLVQDATYSEPPPIRQRYILNDATVEKCGELLGENPTGMLQIRDELAGFLDKLSKEEFQADRSFYLECFEGNNRFTYDRIGRGTIEIENCVLSICGGIQPSRIAPLIHSAVQGKVDDGLIQRFQLAVWPDQEKAWKWIDRAPDEKATAEYHKVIRSMHDLPRPDKDGKPGPLRFSPKAQKLYIAWMEKLHVKIRSGDLHPVMQSHLAKMPKTIATLALLFELIEGGRKKVGAKATSMALEWADYLESHAIRLYSMVNNRATDGAKLILRRREKLPEMFTARDVLRKKWTGLSTIQDVADALDFLVENRNLTESTTRPGSSGGRPKTLYTWHPSLTKKP